MDAFGSMDNDASPGLRFGDNDADDSLSFVTFALVEIEMAASKVCRLAEGEPFGDSRHLFELWLLLARGLTHTAIVLRPSGGGRGSRGSSAACRDRRAQQELWSRRTSCRISAPNRHSYALLEKKA